MHLQGATLLEATDEGLAFCMGLPELVPNTCGTIWRHRTCGAESQSWVGGLKIGFGPDPWCPH